VRLTGQFADTPTRGQSARSQTGQLATVIFFKSRKDYTGLYFFHTESKPKPNPID